MKMDGAKEIICPIQRREPSIASQVVSGVRSWWKMLDEGDCVTQDCQPVLQRDPHCTDNICMRKTSPGFRQWNWYIPKHFRDTSSQITTVSWQQAVLGNLGQDLGNVGTKSHPKTLLNYALSFQTCKALMCAPSAVVESDLVGSETNFGNFLEVI